MFLTWLDSNSWFIELAGQRILLDPWLVGDLMFGNASWFFRSFRHRDRPIPEKIDLILLSQGLADHAHTATLKVLAKSIPVVGSVNAAKVATELGFETVTALKPDELYTLNSAVKIQATPGSPIGPTSIENGYLLKDINTSTTLYYEPHGYHAPSLQQQERIDIVLTPMIDLLIQPGIPVIKGTKSALALAQWIRPQVMIPTAAGGDIEFSGLLVKLLTAKGSPTELQNRLVAAGLSTKVMELVPGVRTEISLKLPTLSVEVGQIEVGQIEVGQIEVGSV